MTKFTLDLDGEQSEIVIANLRLRADALPEGSIGIPILHTVVEQIEAQLPKPEGWFIAEDGHGEPTLWLGREDDPYPVAVLTRHELKRTHAEHLWPLRPEPSPESAEALVQWLVHSIDVEGTDHLDELVREFARRLLGGES